MRRQVSIGAFALALAAPGAAFALGPGLGLDADLDQLNAGLYDSDPAANAPNAGGVFDDLTGSHFVFAPRPTVRIRNAEPRFRVIRAPRITVTP
jgi:hypothetical protein